MLPSGTSGAVVVDTTASANALLHPVPLAQVSVRDEFWAPRLAVNREVTLPGQYRRCEETGRLDNFRRVSGEKDVPFTGPCFNDSDVYKWLEAASWSLATHPDDSLGAMVDEAIRIVGAAQRPDGYLNTYYSVERADERWTNLRDMHELYCAGHLFQAAVAHFRATGERSLLDIAVRFADNICETFGPESSGRREGTCGHPEAEMALVELARATGDDRYLEQARYFIAARGAEHSALSGTGFSEGAFDRRYFQDHVPYADLAEVTGHAVRMVYLSCGAADVCAEGDNKPFRVALDRQWENMTTRRMYVTGGIGARHEGEAFGGDYELPSDRAYAETCAAIGVVMWAWRMLALTGDSRYADTMELALYNGVLSGLSLDGDSYFYVNPLADNGGHRRQKWFGCACCPPNVARLLSSLPGYFYSTGRGTAPKSVYMHLYAAGTASISGPEWGDERFEFDVSTDYPWDGAVTLRVIRAPADPVSLRLRVPRWCDDVEIAVNDEPPQTWSQSPTLFSPPLLGGYAEMERVWKPGDTVRLSMPMPVRTLQPHPYVDSARGCKALARGPLVYCVEAADNRARDIAALRLSEPITMKAERRPDLLGGVVVLTGAGSAVSLYGWEGVLYRNGSLVELVTDGAITAIPYYAWANREPGAMRVWIPREDRADSEP